MPRKTIVVLDDERCEERLKRYEDEPDNLDMKKVVDWAKQGNAKVAEQVAEMKIDPLNPTQWFPNREVDYSKQKRTFWQRLKVRVAAWVLK